MTGRDLENLKTLPVPPPSANAKAAAIVAALAAFDAAQNKNSEATQGNTAPLRQTETSTNKRSFLMRFNSRPNLALAASLTALMIAAPLAFKAQRGDFGKFNAQPEGALAPTQPGLTSQGPEPAKSASDYRANGQGPNLAMGEKQKAETVAPTATVPEDRKFDLGKNAKDGSILTEEFGTGRVSQSRGDEAAAKDQPSPAASAPTSIDGLAASEKPAEVRPERANANAPPPSAPDDSSASAARSRGQPAPLLGGELNALAGKRMQERDAAIADLKQPNPSAWMGDTDTRQLIVTEDNRDKFETREVNPVKQVASEPVSTFSIDVDTASYSFVRRALNAGHLPPKEAVRVEELINYFPYAYPAPESAEVPFKPTVAVVPSPWNANNQLVHVAIKGYDLKSVERPRANLVFLMDVSGSMEPADRLPLVKNAFRLLVDRLKPDDTVGIVTYASGSGVALEPTKVSDKAKILRAIDGLGAGGSTAGAAGISDAYRLAEAGFDKSAVNRVILATDGDFNVGITDQNELKGFIERKRQSGIFLSILGVGQGNHNDALMQTLAQNGNGTAAYADTLSEARKVLVDEASSTLFTIAKDVKVQIEWNPERVAEYRLIGYESRALKREDFNNDKVDAGDIGSGHTVTAIYEVTPVGAPVMADDLRYGKKPATTPPIIRESDGANSKLAELGFLRLRYKRPNEEASQLISQPIPVAQGEQGIQSASTEVRFSAAVAAFGQLVRGAPYLQGYTYDDVLTLAQSARGEDPFGYRAEFLNLVRLAKSAQP